MKIFLGLLVCFFILSPLAAQAQSPENKYVVSVADSLTAAINQTASHKEIEAALKLIFAEHIDADTACIFALGKPKGSLSPKQYQDYAAAYKGLVVNGYAYNFARYAKATYKITSERSFTDKISELRLEVMLNGRTPINIDFFVHKKDSNYKILDIAIESVSTNETNKSLFRKILADKGFDGLLVMLQKKVAQSR